jgi:hypothetical protein
MVLSSKGDYGTAMPAWSMQAGYAHAYLTGSWLNVNRPPARPAKIQHSQLLPGRIGCRFLLAACLQ